MSRSDIDRMISDIEADTRLTEQFTGYRELDSEVLQVMREIPRHEFVPGSSRYVAYLNGPASIGYGQTISQPYIVALMTTLLQLDQNHRVLELGTGSGYQAAVLSRLCRNVYSMEIVPELVKESSRRLHALGYDNVLVKQGDGYYGWQEHEPFDGIIVTAAASHIPAPLVTQLRPGGRLVIPVGPEHWSQELLLVSKDLKGRVQVKCVLNVAFVPLTGEAHQQPYEY